jgi:uncharacterized cupin superfamily protein
MGFSVINVDEIARTGPGGAVRFVRRELGVAAFGINWYEIPPNSEGHEHEPESGQEEVNVIIRGSGVYRVDGERSRCGKGRSCASTRRRLACPWGGRTN